MNFKKNTYFFPFFFLLYEMAGNLSNDLYLPAMSQIADEFQTDIANIGLTIAFWLAGNACLQWLLGPLSDRFGRREILFFGGGLFLISLALSAFAPNFVVMLAGRFGQGIGVASLMVAGYASIHESYSDQDAIKILAWITSISILAPMMGPLIGGYLLQWVDWRSLFLIIAVFSAFALMGLWFCMPSTQAKDLYAFKIKEILNGYTMLLKNKLFMKQSIMLGFIYAALIAWITGSPSVLINEYQLSSVAFGLSQCPIFAGYIIGAQIGQKLISRYAAKKLIQYGLTGCFIGSIVLMGCGYWLPNTLSGLIGATSILVTGAGLITAPLNRLCFQCSEQAKGITSAMFYMCMMFIGTFWSVMVSVMKVETASSLGVMMTISIIAACICFNLRLCKN
ncbi:MAG: hypothetical protein BGO43_04775 [Gammaproteobacteria bacterium 39-13]|nr:Bcr/CflA family efflux MFS transporter [Gammaproteobacteria bacterium]OJV96166.1 MAG: hypothetical protein BGO43_04775 [Gammaproteobacteria bacterium 39-13]